MPFVNEIPLLRSLTYDVSSQLTNFVREVGSQGVRFDLFPSLALPVPGRVALTGKLHPRSLLGSHSPPKFARR